MRPWQSETLAVRLAVDGKAALREAAEQEHRGLVHMLEVMIRDWWGAREGRQGGSPTCDRASRYVPDHGD